MMPDKIKIWFTNKYIQILVLVLASIFTFINIFQNEFVYDDKDFFVNWPSIKDTKFIPALILGDLPPLHQGVYRPVRSLIQFTSYKLWGSNPFGYHLQALLIHISCVILVYLLALELTKNKYLSFASSLLFSIHPTHVEAVTYITASFDTLGIALYLGAFLLYIKARSYSAKTVPLYLFSAFLITIAHFIYEITITFLAIIILYDICFGFLKRKNLIEKIKIYYLFAIPALVYLVIRIFVMQIGNRADYLGMIATVGAHQARVEFPIILGKYLFLILFPFNLTITHGVPGNFVDLYVVFLNYLDPSINLLRSLSKIDFLFPAFFTTLLVFISTKIFARKKLLKFTFLWFLITLLPVVSIFPQGTIMAERFLYLPSVGLFIFLVVFLYESLIKKGNLLIKRGAIFIFIIICICLSFLTVLRNFDWKDSIALWKSAIAVSPDSSLPYGALASNFVEKGEYETAISYYKKSLELDYDNERVHLQLAKVYQLQKKFDLTENEYKIALKINSKNPLTHSNLGELYNQINQVDKAIKEYKIAISLFPANINFYYNLGTIYEQKGDLENAEDYYKQTLLKDPTHAKATINLAVIYIKKDNHTLAIELLEIAKKLDPNNPFPYFNLGKVYEIQKNYQQAAKEYQNGLKLDPNQEEIKKRLDSLLKQ